MKAKVFIIILIILAALAAVGATIYFSETKFLDNIYSDDIEYIEVFNGNNGNKMRIRDQEDIDHIVDNLKSAKVKKSGISLGKEGYSYDMKFIGNDYNVIYELIINSENTVRMDPFFYTTDDYFCYDYIQDIENNFLESKSENLTKDDPNRPNADTGNGEPKTLSEYDIAPDFTAKLVNGGTFKLSDYDNKIVIVNFWATWCGPCVGEMPAFERLKNDKIEDLEIICINCMEDMTTVDKFVKQEGYTFNIGYDVLGNIGKYYPTDGIPYTVIVNKGKVARIYVGAYDAATQYQEYKKAVEECMSE